MKRNWSRMILINLVVLAAAGASAGQELSREARWSQDLDYLIERLEITHPNLYANIPREEFLGQAEQLREEISESTDVELVFGIQELVARIGNSHTLCRPVPHMRVRNALTRQFRFYPVQYYPFADGLFVQAAAERYADIVGQKVVRIGRLTAAEVMRELARFVAADNPSTTLANIPRWCLNDGQLLRHIKAADSPDSLTLTLEDSLGRAFTRKIVTDPSLAYRPPRFVAMNDKAENPLPLYRQRPRDNYWFTHLPERDAVYLQINLLNHQESEPFGEFCARLFAKLDVEQAGSLIIDLRLSPGGDHIELPLLKGILARPQIDRPDRLFVIVGRLTGSAAQHLTSVLEQYTNATFFGEATSSRPNQYGAMQQFTLPHSGLEILCALDYFQDAQPADYALASVPDVRVLLRAEDFRANRDPVLERIFAFDSFGPVQAEFSAALKAAYTQNGLPGLRETYGALKDDYLAQGFDLESVLYGELDGWVGRRSENTDAYVEYLEFMHGELPDSAVVTYDLAYWRNEAGDQEEASRLYRKCLELNPENHHARWRLGLIELEKKWQSE